MLLAIRSNYLSSPYGIRAFSLTSFCPRNGQVQQLLLGILSKLVRLLHLLVIAAPLGGYCGPVSEHTLLMPLYCTWDRYPAYNNGGVDPAMRGNLLGILILKLPGTKLVSSCT